MGRKWRRQLHAFRRPRRDPLQPDGSFNLLNGEELGGCIERSDPLDTDLSAPTSAGAAILTPDLGVASNPMPGARPVAVGILAIDLFPPDLLYFPRV